MLEQNFDMSDNKDPTNIRDDIEKNEHNNYTVDNEYSQDDLDPRIKKNLELLNDSSDKLNNATTDLTYIRNRLNLMVSKIETLLGDYYLKHRRSIEKTRNYLSCLLSLKIEADSCYIQTMEYDASLFALEQCRTICNRLEKDLIDSNNSKPRDMNSCVINLHQLNEANEKLDYWTKKVVDQESIRDDALFELRSVYSACANTIKRYKSRSNPGMLYFRQTIFFYKCIHTITIHIEKLQQCVLQLNDSYNDLLISTNQLTFELQNKDTLEIPDITSMVFQNYLEHSKQYDSNIGEGRVLVDKIFRIIFQMDYICTNSNIQHLSTTMSGGEVQPSDNCERPRFDSDSSYELKTKVSESSTPKNDKTEHHDPSNGIELNVSDCLKTLDLNDSSEIDSTKDCNNNNNVDNCIKFNNIHHTTDTSLSSTASTSMSNPTSKGYDSEANFTRDCQCHGVDQSRPIPKRSPSKSNKSKSFHLDKNTISRLFGYNGVGSKSRSVKLSDETAPTFVHQKISSPSHRKAKSDFTYNKIIIKEIPPTKKLFVASSESIIDEENPGDLTVCNADVNSSKINMDLSAYDMNSSFINNIHLYIALSLEKYKNLPNLPKIGYKQNFKFKSFF